MKRAFELRVNIMEASCMTGRQLMTKTMTMMMTIVIIII